MCGSVISSKCWTGDVLTSGEESLHVSLGVLHSEMDPERVAKQLPVLPA